MVVPSKTISTTWMACMKHAGRSSFTTSTMTSPDTHTLRQRWGILVLVQQAAPWWHRVTGQRRTLHTTAKEGMRGHPPCVPEADQQSSVEEVSSRSHSECQRVVEPGYLDEGPESQIRWCLDDSPCSSARSPGVEQRKPISLGCDGWCRHESRIS